MQLGLTGNKKKTLEEIQKWQRFRMKGTQWSYSSGQYRRLKGLDLSEPKRKLW